jgi:protease IV
MMGRRRRALAVAGLVYLGVGVVFLAFLWGTVGNADADLGVFGGRVAIVEIEGIILEVDDLVRDLKSHRENPSVRAVVIRINSPGGVVGPTQEVHQALMKLREGGKPVVASLSSIAASGGYYIAVAADRVYANPGTLTGSIGVIMQFPNVDGLLKKVGVDYVVVKAGRYKDLGNFARPMRPEERQVLQGLLDDVHSQFIDAVASGRKLSRNDVVSFADGRIFSGAQAKSMAMVDELGSLDDAVNAAAKLAGLKVPPRVLLPRRKSSIVNLIRSELGLPAGASILGARMPVFQTPLYLMP